MVSAKSAKTNNNSVKQTKTLEEQVRSALIWAHKSDYDIWTSYSNPNAIQILMGKNVAMTNLELKKLDALGLDITLIGSYKCKPMIYLERRTVA